MTSPGMGMCIGCCFLNYLLQKYSLYHLGELQINIPTPKINNYNMRGTARKNDLRLNLLAGKNTEEKENTELSSETMERLLSAIK